ncbi:MAG: YlxM family DNA-binding protein [Lachnospiraceae bacterium]|nr:YlxM family DNA-binding protein [Candidatus Fimimorpha excrementavium]
MEKIVKQTLLYDFYGELLTDHQRAIYEDVVFNDLSLSEVAEMQGISRQGVHDLIRRCDKILAGYEDKLHLIARFHETRRSVEEMYQMVKQYAESKDEALLSKITDLYHKVLEEI